MNYRNGVVYNEDITYQKIFAVLLCFTIILIPLSLTWLYLFRKPTDFIEGIISNKRSAAKTVSTGYGGTIKPFYYISIGENEFEVSGNMYQMLSVGDYIFAGYRRKVIHYFSK